MPAAPQATKSLTNRPASPAVAPSNADSVGPLNAQVTEVAIVAWLGLCVALILTLPYDGAMKRLRHKQCSIHLGFLDSVTAETSLAVG